MSSNENAQSRDDVLAAREAKKLAKLKAKSKGDASVKKENVPAKEKGQKQAPVKESRDVTSKKVDQPKEVTSKKVDQPEVVTPKKVIIPEAQSKNSPKCIDEVDRAAVNTDKIVGEVGDKTKDKVLAERAAKKAAKQAKKKGAEDVGANPEMTVKDVAETLKDIKNVAKEVQDMTAKSSSENKSKASSEDAKAQGGKIQGQSEESKSKAELRAERRAKQEAQRAAKQGAIEPKSVKPEASKTKAQDGTKPEVAKEKSPKPKAIDKAKAKPTENRVNWFQHLYTKHDKDTLKEIPINSNLHPAITKLGVQLATRVVSGSNARCIALLDAIKKMIRDYTLPAKTEFSRGLEAHLAASLEYLWRMRPPSASQTNAVKYLRHHLKQLPNNVDEFDAKKTLQTEIDRYIEDQIDKAGEAISMSVRQKISSGDHILTYGCSSLIERILVEAWKAGLEFHTVVVGDRVHGGGREMLRRLVAAGLACTYLDITALSFVMNKINKVVLGASALLMNGWVLGAAGTAQAALAARAHNVPVLVACETHKFSERVQTDAFVYNEIGDPDELIDKTDSDSPLKDWRSNPNLTPLNLTYDVTPPSLVTAVVTEKAILPCTSAPVVMRTKLSEYGA